MRKHLRRAMLGVTTTALLAGGAVLTPAEAANAKADASADWLARQLRNGLVISGYDDGTQWVRYTDQGLTLDVFFALRALRVKPAVRSEIIEALEPQVDEYVGSGGTTYAGAAGKLLTAVQLRGLNPAGYGDGDLVARLEGQVHTAADSERGRAEDSIDGGADYSNSIGQAWVVRALTAADSDLADDTVAFLLKQQCAAGFFRLYMESADHTCAKGVGDESQPSVDATAFAVQALRTARAAGVPGLTDDIADAVAWLVRVQAGNGSFRDGGVSNANSTGVAAETLALVSRVGAAGTAAEWLRKHQVSAGLERRSALTGEFGAVAYDDAALRAGKSDDITRDVRYQWRRATAQAAVGLDALLPATALEVRAPRRADRREQVTVRTTGLLPGEHYQVRRGARKVAGGWVPDSGVVVAQVTMPQRRKNVIVSVVGSRAVRNGSTVVRVR